MSASVPEEIWDQFPEPYSYRDFQRYQVFINSRYRRVLPNTVITEKHHVLPNSFVPNQFVITLSNREHYIAHYILHKAFGESMTQAFWSMIQYQRYSYELSSREYETLRNSYRDYISTINSGRVVVGKNGSLKRIRPQELHQYQKQGWSVEEGRSLVGSYSRGSVIVHQGEVDIMVNADELETYLSSGWEKGRSIKARQSYLGVNLGRRGTLEESITKSQGAKNRKVHANKGRVWVNDGSNNHIILVRELQSYLDAGYKRGRTWNSSFGANKGRATISKGGVVKYARQEELDAYLEAGWKIGRKH